MQDERDQGADAVSRDDAGAQQQALAEGAGAGAEAEGTDGDGTRESMPRWRQIEIMRERAQLREALGDLDGEFDELDELEREVFGSESEHDLLYQHGVTDIEEDIEIDDDDDMDDEDFEDFDEE
jgi:hypothetical protein